MVDVIGRAKVIITGDVDARSIDQAGGKIGSRLKVGAAVGAAALGTLAVAGVKAFKAFEEAESVSAKLSNVLGNMGKTSAVPELEKLASTLQRQTGISDETIKSGQTLLATFDAVAASAGETGGTFDRATRAAVDMSSVFGSVESASRVLGKALSDPEKAAALLRRSNVVLTEEQQNLIKAFNDAGDAAGAQDVILSALEDRYKGTAEAGAKESQKISEAMGEIEEAAGKALAALLGGKEGKNSLSGELFKVSDSISELAASEAWATTGENLRDTADDVGTVGAFIGYLIRQGDKLEKKWPGWGKAVKLFTNPIGAAIDVVEDLADAIDRLLILSDDNQLDELLNKTYKGSEPGLNLLDTTRAVGGPASGLTLVGERGPELVSLPAGSYVHNNSQSKEMLADAGGTTNNTIFNITGPVSLAELRQRAAWYDTYGTRFG